MKNCILLLLITSFFSCSNELEKVKIENAELNATINSLHHKLDSLKNLSSVQFESIIFKDISLDSLRSKSVSDYILPIHQNELKTTDSLLILEYLSFSKKYPNSYFSMYAIDRIKSIREKKRILKIHQLVGKWRWETKTNIMFPFKSQINEEIQFDKNNTVKFFKNGRLVSEEKYTLLRKSFTGHHIKFSKRGIYAISIKANGLLTLTKGDGFCIDCGTDVYKKSSKI